MNLLLTATSWPDVGLAFVACIPIAVLFWKGL